MQEMLIMSMEAARNIVDRQTMNMHNLANVSTDGFRKEIALLQTVESGDELTSVPDFSPGPIRTTGRALDIAISGDGWFEIVAPDGSTAFSRRGDLHVNELGQLLNGARQQLVGEGGPISIPEHSRLEIGTDGTVSVLPLGERPNTLAVVDRISLVRVDPQDLVRGDDGLFRLSGGGEAEPAADIRILSGSLEGSNVNAVESLVQMIELSRAFEAHVKMMKQSQAQVEQLARVMSMA